MPLSEAVSVLELVTSKVDSVLDPAAAVAAVKARLAEQDAQLASLRRRNHAQGLRMAELDVALAEQRAAVLGMCDTAEAHAGASRPCIATSVIRKALKETP
jgi:hypothetical protein